MSTPAEHYLIRGNALHPVDLEHEASITRNYAGRGRWVICTCRTCSTCGQLIQVREDGTLQNHGSGVGLRDICKGSYTPAPADALELIIHDVEHDIGTQVERWLQSTADLLHLTPEQLAERYELLWEPYLLDVTENRVTARVRLELKGQSAADLPASLAPIFLEPTTPRKARLR